MIKLRHKADCCGCEACLQICPFNCIRFEPDNEGYLYPNVDLEKCVDCHLCEKVCPIINNNFSNGSVSNVCYAAKIKNDKIRLNSSSGGVFWGIANEIISVGGIAYGVTFDNEFNVIHNHADNCDGITHMMSSKYVQSRVGNSYKHISELLKQGKKVLFSGVPCQIAGLKNFLKKDYENLLTVEVVCHGVPSPGVWRLFLSEVKRTCNIDKIASISFREKNGYSWSHYGMKITGTNGKVYDCYAGETSFMRAFLSNNCLRPSCYECKFKCNSGADITLGDFWGIEKIKPEFADNIGVSMVILHTSKAQINFPIHLYNLTSVKFDDVLKTNKSLSQSSPKPLTRRKFFKLLNFRNPELSLTDIVRKTIPKPSEQTLIERLLELPVRGYRWILRNGLGKNI